MARVITLVEEHLKAMLGEGEGEVEGGEAGLAEEGMWKHSRGMERCSVIPVRGAMSWQDFRGELLTNYGKCT